MALSLIPGRVLPLPGTCVSCGSTGIDMVDTGRNQQFYGALLICIICFRDGALRIPELDLFSKSLHDDIVADLEEKLEWRKNLEPTVAQLELDISNALNSARHGFSHRYLSDSASNEILSTATTQSESPYKAAGLIDDDPEQLFFTISELRELGDGDGSSDNNDWGSPTGVIGNQRQADDNVGNEVTAGISSGASDEQSS